MNLEDVEMIVSGYFERYIKLMKNPNIEHVIIFRNHGNKAGTSLEHPHSQIIGTPVMPQEFWRIVQGAASYYEYWSRCPYCHILEFEDQEGDRKICENDSFIAFTPFAAKYPFEIWIIPRTHNASFSQMSMREGRDLARILKETLARLHKCLDDPSYNLTLRSLLNPEKEAQSFHWHIEIIPRLTTPAGFELGTGMYINVTTPEAAADYLRQAE